MQRLLIFLWSAAGGRFKLFELTTRMHFPCQIYGGITKCCNAGTCFSYRRQWPVCKLLLCRRHCQNFDSGGDYDSGLSHPKLARWMRFQTDSCDRVEIPPWFSKGRFRTKLGVRRLGSLRAGMRASMGAGTDSRCLSPVISARMPVLIWDSERAMKYLRQGGVM